MKKTTHDALNELGFVECEGVKSPHSGGIAKFRKDGKILCMLATHDPRANVYVTLIPEGTGDLIGYEGAFFDLWHESGLREVCRDLWITEIGDRFSKGFDSAFIEALFGSSVVRELELALAS